MATLLTTEELHNSLAKQRELLFTAIFCLCDDLTKATDNVINDINNMSAIECLFCFISISKKPILEHFHSQRKQIDILRNDIIAYQNKKISYTDIKYSNLDMFVGKEMDFGDRYIDGMTATTNTIRNIKILLTLCELSYRKIYDIDCLPDVTDDINAIKIQYIDESDIIQTKKFWIKTYQQTIDKDKVGLTYKIEKDPNGHEYNSVMYLTLTVLAKKLTK